MKDPIVPLVWTDSPAAAVIAAELEEQGIEAVLEPVHSGMFGAPMGRVRVRVRRSRAHSAMAVLEYLREKHPRMPLDFTGVSELPPFAGA